MNPINFKGANTLLQAAEQDKKAGTVSDMPVFIGKRELRGGGHSSTIISCWQPDPWERAEVAAGKPIYLELLNPPKNPPPVCLFTQNPFEPPPARLVLSNEDERERLEQEIREVKIPQEVFDEIWLHMGMASKLGSDNDALAKVSMELTKAIALRLESAYTAGCTTGYQQAVADATRDIAEKN